MDSCDLCRLLLILPSGCQRGGVQPILIPMMNAALDELKWAIQCV